MANAITLNTLNNRDIINYEIVPYVDLSLVFDEEHTNDLITKNNMHFKYLARQDFVKDWTNKYWKQHFGFNKVEEFFENLGIKLYYGYETCLFASSYICATHGTDDQLFMHQHFIIYTNTKFILYVEVIKANFYNKKYSADPSVIITVAFDDFENQNEMQSKRYTIVFQLSIRTYTYGADLYINHTINEISEINTPYIPANYKWKPISYEILTTQYKDIYEDIAEVLDQTSTGLWIHPYVYLDYLKLSHPKKILEVLLQYNTPSNSEKKEIEILKNYISVLENDTAICHEEIKNLEKKMDYYNKFIEDLQDENEKFREEIEEIEKNSSPQLIEKFHTKINAMEEDLNFYRRENTMLSAQIKFYGHIMELSDTVRLDKEDSVEDTFIQFIYDTTKVIVYMTGMIYICANIVANIKLAMSDISEIAANV